MKKTSLLILFFYCTALTLPTVYPAQYPAQYPARKLQKNDIKKRNNSPLRSNTSIEIELKKARQKEAEARERLWSEEKKLDDAWAKNRLTEDPRKVKFWELDKKYQEEKELFFKINKIPMHKIPEANEEFINNHPDLAAAKEEYMQACIETKPSNTERDKAADDFRKAQNELIILEKTLRTIKK